MCNIKIKSNEWSPISEIYFLLKMFAIFILPLSIASLIVWLHCNGNKNASFVMDLRSIWYNFVLHSQCTVFIVKWHVIRLQRRWLAIVISFRLRFRLLLRRVFTLIFAFELLCYTIYCKRRQNGWKTIWKDSVISNVWYF